MPDHLLTTSQHTTDHSKETWALFSKSVREIQNNNAHQLSYEENYRHAYNLVLYKHGELLYNGVCELVSQNLDRLTREVIVPAFPSGGDSDPMHRSQEGERLLKAFRNVWEEHISSMSKLRDLLKYMVRVLPTREASCTEVNRSRTGPTLHHTIFAPYTMQERTYSYPRSLTKLFRIHSLMSLLIKYVSNGMVSRSIDPL